MHDPLNVKFRKDNFFSNRDTSINKYATYIILPIELN